MKFMIDNGIEKYWKKYNGILTKIIESKKLIVCLSI